MTQTIRGLGRLDLPGRRMQWDAELLGREAAEPAMAASAGSDGR
jgi:hypothetical protein